MRVMVMVKATPNSGAGAMPEEALLAGMGKFNEELVRAGIMQAGEGLRPSSRGKRVRFAKGRRTVVDGPGEESEIEIRPIFEAEDFGAEFTPELREQEERMRAETARKHCT